MEQEGETTAISYTVKTEQFEGPLDLLLQLIEKRKLFINDFTLANVADDFIQHIRRFDNFPVSDVANFLVVASALVLIKSRSILPQLTLSHEEEADINELKKRLKLFELFRDVAGDIKTHFGKVRLFERTFRPQEVIIFTPDERIDQQLIHDAVMQVIASLPKQPELPKATVKKVISLEEMVERLADRVKVALKMSFSDFSTYQKGRMIKKEERVHVIVSFLAMLEMVKQGVLQVTQHEEYGDIHMEKQQIETPVYM